MMRYVNLHQIGLGMTIYADEARELSSQQGDRLGADRSAHAQRQLDGADQSLHRHHQCLSLPANKLVPQNVQSWFNYFNGARAAYVLINDEASVDNKKIMFPSAFVLRRHLGFHAEHYFDKDDYTQN